MRKPGRLIGQILNSSVYALQSFGTHKLGMTWMSIVMSLIFASKVITSLIKHGDPSRMLRIFFQEIPSTLILLVKVPKREKFPISRRPKWSIQSGFSHQRIDTAKKALACGMRMLRATAMPCRCCRKQR